MKVMVINGSMSVRSVSRTALRAAVDRLEGAGVAVVWVEVRDWRLPIFDPDAPMPAEAERLRDLALEADAFLVGSPEYHGAMSGAVKNLLDYLSSRQFAGKAVGLVVASGGARGGINTLNALRVLFRSLRSWVVPEQVSLWKEDLTPEGQVNPDIGRRLSALAQSLIETADMLAYRRQRQALTAEK